MDLILLSPFQLRILCDLWLWFHAISDHRALTQLILLEAHVTPAVWCTVSLLHTPPWHRAFGTIDDPSVSIPEHEKLGWIVCLCCKRIVLLFSLSSGLENPLWTGLVWVRRDFTHRCLILRRYILRIYPFITGWVVVARQNKRSKMTKSNFWVRFFISSDVIYYSFHI